MFIAGSAKLEASGLPRCLCSLFGQAESHTRLLLIWARLWFNISQVAPSWGLQIMWPTALHPQQLEATMLAKKAEMMRKDAEKPQQRCFVYHDQLPASSNNLSFVSQSVSQSVSYRANFVHHQWRWNIISDAPVMSVGCQRVSWEASTLLVGATRCFRSQLGSTYLATYFFHYH